MNIGRTLGMLSLVLVIAGLAMAAEKTVPAKKVPPCPADQRITRWLDGMTLTDTQKTELNALKKEFGPKLMEVLKKMPVLTDEQKKAQADAVKAAVAAGKKGPELMEAGRAALKLTDEQKAKMAEAWKVVGPVEKELRDKVLAVLTPDQQAQLKQKFPAPKQKPAK